MRELWVVPFVDALPCPVAHQWWQARFDFCLAGGKLPPFSGGIGAVAHFWQAVVAWRVVGDSTVRPIRIRLCKLSIIGAVPGLVAFRVWLWARSFPCPTCHDKKISLPTNTISNDTLTSGNFPLFSLVILAIASWWVRWAGTGRSASWTVRNWTVKFPFFRAVPCLKPWGIRRRTVFCLCHVCTQEMKFGHSIEKSKWICHYF